MLYIWKRHTARSVGLHSHENKKKKRRKGRFEAMPEAQALRAELSGLQRSMAGEGVYMGSADYESELRGRAEMWKRLYPSRAQQWQLATCSSSARTRTQPAPLAAGRARRPRGPAVCHAGPCRRRAPLATTTRIPKDTPSSLRSIVPSTGRAVDPHGCQTRAPPPDRGGSVARRSR